MAYGSIDRKNDIVNDVRCELLSLSDDSDPTQDDALVAYIRAGELEEVHLGYKCSIRKNWWVVPSVWIPDGFMLRQIHSHPVLFANSTAATSTDTVHRVRLTTDADIRQLSAVTFNSATFAFAEILGRSYGGGILELEPSEARALPIPNPDLATSDDHSRMDSLIRSSAWEEALDYGDETFLVKGLGWTQDRVSSLRSAWLSLRARRLRRK